MLRTLTTTNIKAIKVNHLKLLLREWDIHTILGES